MCHSAFSDGHPYQESVCLGDIARSLHTRHDCCTLLATGQVVKCLKVRENQLAVAGGGKVQEQLATSAELNFDETRFRDCMHLQLT